MNIEQLHNKFLQCSSVSTDTRNIQADCMFFALKGTNFDGNKFAEQALANGAKWAVVDDPSFAGHEHMTVVEDVLQTLQQLGKFHRQLFDIPVLGITGSNGKTTTKELVQIVLEQKYNLIATIGNYNNHIGVPLTLLRINKDTELAIIEMGANHQGEIGILSGLADPNYGIITNIGKAHLEGFGSYEIIKQTKNELYTHVFNRKGTLIVNADDELLMDLSKIVEDRHTYGNQGEIKGRFEEVDGLLQVSWTQEQEHTIKTQLFGAFNFYNVMAAVATGRLFGVEANAINDALESYVSENNRSQIINKGANTIYLDAYNANPTSMASAMKFFGNLQAENKIVILGDMFELGEDSKHEHKTLLNKLTSLELNECILVGNEFYQLHQEYDGFLFFKTTSDLLDWMKNQPFKGVCVFIKGSRGMQLEQVVDHL